MCVTTVTYSVLINGQPHGMIVPQRGLRQGDPLSPFLFVLCTEGLTHLLNRAEHDGLISGIKFSPMGPSIHHLLFADDSLFVCKAEESQCEALQQILNSYGRATGQIINLDKSSITFGSKVDERVKGLIKNKLGIMVEGGAGSYLGLPECFSGSKKDMLAYIHERLKTRFSGWFARTLSQGGKEILLKSVAMAMPVYAMSCFKLPKGTCETLTSAMASFWWSSVEEKRKIHWIAWEKMCLPKDQGGMGFKDIQLFNQALLAKQAWRLLQAPDCLFALFMKSRYFEEDYFLQAHLGPRPSFAWRSILHGRDLLESGLKQMVGDGTSLRVWTSPWLEDGGMRAPLMKNIFVDLELRVSDLIDHEAGNWNRGKLDELFYPREVDIILKSKPVVDSLDFKCWKHNKSGAYTVRSGYWKATQLHKVELLQVANAQPSLNGIKEQIWSVLSPTKIKIFMWKVVSGAIPVAEKLRSRGMTIDLRCQICGMEGESINHVIFTCPVARQVWALSFIPCPENGFHPSSIYQNFYHILRMGKNHKIPLELRRSFPWIMWRLWKNRNNLLFEGLVYMANDIMVKVREDVSQWFLAQELVSLEQEELVGNVQVKVKKWKPPEKPWLKCNIGVSWDRENSIGGAAWVLRNWEGTVLLHSRRSFGSISGKNEADLEGWLWAVESMSSLQVGKVMFAVEDKVLFGAVTRPPDWPSFKFHSTKLLEVLNRLSFWILVLEERSANLGDYLIARSVITEGRVQSYVASGYPFWLHDLFTKESCFTCL